MAHFVEDLRYEAEQAIAAMQEAALAARHAHARAELMRHMLTTTRKVADLPKREAVDRVVSEWMAAWHLDRSAGPETAKEMEALTGTFYDYVKEPSDPTDAALRDACATLDRALERHGTTISDQMAWRSQCAHGWWESVRPAPLDLPGRKDRPSVPKPEPNRPFWDAGCADFCK
jgi:hypothetical protein